MFRDGQNWHTAAVILPFSISAFWQELTFPQYTEKAAVEPDYLQRKGRRSWLCNLDLTLKLSLELGFPCLDPRPGLEPPSAPEAFK